MKKFAYKTIEGTMHNIPDLNELGSEGWEICGVVKIEYKVFYFFKREV